MLLRKAIVAIGAVAVLSWWARTDGQAQGPIDKGTLFTFNQPIALPGVTLPAGTYLFRLADPTGSRKVVQVLSEDGSDSYAMLLSIPAHRYDIPDGPEIHFMETTSNTPASVKIWWYPGGTIGHEFIYPEEQAMLLARGSGETVLMAHAESAAAEELKSAELARVAPGGDETSVKPEDAPAAVRPTEPVRHGTIASSDELADLKAAGTTGEVPARTELPGTASLMPIVARALPEAAPLASDAAVLRDALIHGLGARGRMALYDAVGQDPDTPLPWQHGNRALAGHRDTFFRALRDLRVGDHLSLTPVHGDLQYRVREMLIVDPRDLRALDSTVRPTLTLVTCCPFSYVRRAPKRFVVHADRLLLI